MKMKECCWLNRIFAGQIERRWTLTSNILQSIGQLLASGVAAQTSFAVAVVQTDAVVHRCTNAMKNARVVGGILSGFSVLLTAIPNHRSKPGRGHHSVYFYRSSCTLVGDMTLISGASCQGAFQNEPRFYPFTTPTATEVNLHTCPVSVRDDHAYIWTRCACSGLGDS